MGKSKKTAGKKPSRSGRITLRMDPELHDAVAEAAHKAGMDLNGAIVFLIRQSLPSFVLSSVVLREEIEMANDFFLEWKQINPTSPIVKYIDDAKRLWAGDLVFMEDGHGYHLDPEKNKVVQKYITIADAEREAMREDFEANGPFPRGDRK